MSVLPFPAPSGPFDRETPETRAFASEIRRWRDQVERELAAPNGGPARAVRFFQGVLRTEWTPRQLEWAARLPYNIRPFPAREGAAMGAMAWRATLHDLLSDIWDVAGTPELEMEECSWIDDRLRPEGGAARCAWCLLPFPEERLQPDRHGCILIAEVRARWPKNPFGDQPGTTGRPS